MVVLRDRYDNPVHGKTLNLVASGAAISLTQPAAQTDVDGIAFGSLQAAAPQTVTIQAYDVTDGITLTTAARIHVSGTDPGRSSVVVTPDAVVADGASPATVTVTLRSGNGAPRAAHGHPRR